MSHWQIPVLTYHALHAPGWDYHSNDHVALEADLALLLELDYRVVPLVAIAEHLTDGRHPQLESGRYVGLSFDDGTDHDYYDFSHPGYGHLKSFRTLLQNAPGLGWDGGLPNATSFVIASPEARRELDRACIAGRDQWRDVWWREAAQSGLIDIGNHSWDHNHPLVPQVCHGPGPRNTFKTIQDDQAAERQILQAERFIQENTGGLGCRLFAYPYGESNAFLVDDWFPRHQHDFIAAFGTQPAHIYPGSQRWRLPRYVCGEHWRSRDELRDILR